MLEHYSKDFRVLPVIIIIIIYSDGVLLHWRWCLLGY